jgi:hypothetical protein
LFASGDIYNQPLELTGEFDWQKRNMFDELASKFIRNNKLHLKNYYMNHLGDLSLCFSNGCIFEVLIVNSDDSEGWRFFKNDENSPHFIANCRGIEKVCEKTAQFLPHDQEKLKIAQTVNQSSADIIKYTDIYSTLDKIKGQKALKMTRVCDFAWQARLDLAETFDRCHELASHRWHFFLFSAFRLLDEAQKIYLSSGDLSSPRDWNEWKATVDENYEVHYDWSAPGATLFDTLADLWTHSNIADRDVFIQNYNLNKTGDLTLWFSNGHKLQIFVDISNEQEAWAFEPNDATQPYVAAIGTGVTIQTRLRR